MRVCLLLPISLAVSQVLAAPGDVPQWRGPNRDGVFVETGLLQQWPSDGPPLAWKVKDLGKGMASVAVVGGRIYTMGSKGGQFIICLDAVTQKELWRAKVADKGSEPRCTPTVDGDLIYAVSTEGDLVCVQASDGKEVWRKSFAADFDQAPKPTWQFSESPLVDGNQLIVQPGSATALMAALDKKTGTLIWKTAGTLTGKGHPGAGYTGAVVSTAGGIRQYVTMVGKGAIGVAAANGQLLWHYNRVANGTAVIPTPLVWDDYVFVSSGYGTGAALLKIVKAGTSPGAASAVSEVDATKVAELTGQVTKLQTELAAHRATRNQATRGTSAYEAADKLVQALKPDLAKAQSALNAARGLKDDGAAHARIPGSPVSAEEVYFLNAGVFQNHHGGMVRLGDYIYAGKGHNNGFPICLEWRTGRVVWEQPRGPGKESAAVIAADGHLYFRYQDAVMALVQATPAGYVEKGVFTLAAKHGPSWPHPAIHAGKLYIRDQEELLCYDLRAK